VKAKEHALNFAFQEFFTPMPFDKPKGKHYNPIHQI
jgi:hypothetical protein